MDKQLLKSRVDTVINLLDSVDYYHFVYEENYVILEVTLNKLCLFPSTLRVVIAVSEYIYASDWHVELEPVFENVYNQFKLCFFIDNKRYEK